MCSVFCRVSRSRIDVPLLVGFLCSRPFRCFVTFASFGAFWGLSWLLVACLAFWLGLLLLVGLPSGMSTVEVHEWCLVCYVWMAVCLRNNVHAAYLFSFATSLGLACAYCGFPVLHT
jgi:hypothetical protein